MSHDQKPMKVRLLDASGEKSRRRGDTPPVVIDGNAPAASAADHGARTGAGSSASSPMGGRAGKILALTFVLGCGIGGAAIAGLYS